MDFPINVDVVCADGAFGKSTAVIVDPKTETVVYLTVRDPVRAYTEYLVPVVEIEHADSKKIQLKCTRSELEQMEPFIETQFVTVPSYSYADDLRASGAEVVVLEHPQIPEGTIAVSRGMAVEATDGLVGSVDELVIDTQTGKVTHLVMRTAHLWGSAEVCLPVSQVQRVDQFAVYLDRDKESIEVLPAVQVRRHYRKDEVANLDIEVLIWVFASTASADEALERLKATAKKQDIKIRNAAILVKGVDGKARAREIADLGPRRGALTGVITGGLIGLLAGPGGLLLGAAAGAATGSAAAKKIDRGFSEDYLKKLQSDMQLGNSALVTLVESQFIPSLIEALDTFSGKLIRQKITDDIVIGLTG